MLILHSVSYLKLFEYISVVPILEPTPPGIVVADVGSTREFTFSLSPQEVRITNCMMTKHRRSDEIHDVGEGTYTCAINHVTLQSNTYVTPRGHSETASLVPDVPDRKCLCSLSKTPQNLIINVFFYRVSFQDGGRWYLSVSNKLGSGYADFGIKVVSGELIFHFFHTDFQK